MAKTINKERLSTAEAKKEFLKLFSAGMTKERAIKIVGRSSPTLYNEWLKKDPDFIASYNALNNGEELDSEDESYVPRKEVPDFPIFCEEHLGMTLFNHQLQWFDVLEGREPRNLHPSMTYNPSSFKRVVINVPPGHAKTTTVSVAYSVWKIIKNPDISIAIISKTTALALKIVYQIKEILTSPLYKKLQEDFGPPGGWKNGASKWASDTIYVGNKTEGKDPTLEAKGWGSQIYGSRLDLIIFDDIVDSDNFKDWQNQLDKVRTMYDSRMSRRGMIVCVGTRIGAKDIYSELPNSDHYPRRSPWTLFIQPALLESAENPEDWVTLWPYSNKPEDPDDEPLDNGLYYKRDGLYLSEIREGLTENQWLRIYQQKQVSDESVFNGAKVMDACGPTPIDLTGKYIVAGFDPAASGFSAAVVMAIDYKSADRWILDIWNKHATNADIKNLIKDWTNRYNIQEWRIEINAFQRFLLQDEELNTYTAARGCRMVGHMTGNNKHDSAFGVAAMATTIENGLMHFPPANNSNVDTMIEQMVQWLPSKPRGQIDDIIMALWFAELKAIEIVKTMGKQDNFIKPSRANLYYSSKDINKRKVIRFYEQDTVDNWEQE